MLLATGTVSPPDLEWKYKVQDFYKTLVQENHREEKEREEERERD